MLFRIQLLCESRHTSRDSADLELLISMRFKCRPTISDFYSGALLHITTVMMVEFNYLNSICINFAAGVTNEQIVVLQCGTNF